MRNWLRTNAAFYIYLLRYSHPVPSIVAVIPLPWRFLHNWVSSAWQKIINGATSQKLTQARLMTYRVDVSES